MPITETLSGTHDEAASRFKISWHKRLDALARGECSEGEFMDEISILREADADSVWDVVALLDQRYRRGQIPIDLFRSIESKIARLELSVSADGRAVDFVTQSLEPVVRRGSQRVREPARLDAPPETPAVGIGSVLRNRYYIESRLGSGGMGTVYKAVDRVRSEHAEIDSHVAVKILHEKTHSRPDVLAKLRREFYCAQALSHRSIVKVFELDRDREIAFFTMELLEGELLSRVIQRFHPLPVDRSHAWRIIREIAAGLVHAHSRKVVHADLKPQNIMVVNAGEVRILDFGTSSACVRMPPRDGSQKSDVTAVTPAYASCELLEGQPADPSDDLYALACLSYELLAGEHPFQQQRSTEARKLGMMPRRPPELTHRQWETLKMGLAWKREDRSISVRDWLAALNPGTALSGQESSEREPPRQIVRPHDLVAARPYQRQGISPRMVALLAVPLIGLTMWAVLGRLSGAGTSGSAGAVSMPAMGAGAPMSVKQTLQTPASLSRESSSERAAAVETQLPDTAPPSEQVHGSQPVSAASAPLSAAANMGAQPLPVTAKTRRPVLASLQALSNDRADKIGIAATAYRIRSGDKFAEIRVHRSSDSKSNSSFVWWTEPSSALAGADYVPQTRTTAFFPPGGRTVSLFVKLVANASRKEPDVFYVVIGNPSKGNALNGVSKALIALSPSR